PRMATVKTVTPVRMLAIDRDEFLAAATGGAAARDADDELVETRLAVADSPVKTVSRCRAAAEGADRNPRYTRSSGGGAQRRDPRADVPPPRPWLRQARGGDGELSVGRHGCPRQLRAQEGRDGRVRRGPDPLPDARPPRNAFRAQRVPLSHPLPDLRRPRVD